MEKNSAKKKDRPFGWKYLVYDIVKFFRALTAPLVFRPRSYYISPKAHTKIKKGGAILIANHASYMDPMKCYYAMWYRRVHLLAMPDVFERKFFGWFLKHGLCIKVEGSGRKAFGEVCRRLDEGKVVGLFPEGHISRGQTQMMDFKSGVLLMAMKCDVPIVPVYFKPLKHWYSRHIFVYGEPVRLNELCESEKMTISDLDTAAERLQERVTRLKELAEEKTTRKGKKCSESTQTEKPTVRS